MHSNRSLTIHQALQGEQVNGERGKGDAGRSYLTPTSINTHPGGVTHVYTSPAWCCPQKETSARSFLPDFNVPHLLHLHLPMPTSVSLLTSRVHARSCSSGPNYQGPRQGLSWPSSHLCATRAREWGAFCVHVPRGPVGSPFKFSFLSQHDHMHCFYTTCVSESYCSVFLWTLMSANRKLGR